MKFPEQPESDEARHIRMRRFVKMCRSRIAEYGILSVEPLIFFMPISPNLDDFLHHYRLLFGSLKNRRIYAICCTHWYFERKEDAAKLATLLVRCEKEFPQLTLIILSNTENQLNLLEKYKIETVFCNSNAMVDERVFRVLPGTEKKYDAVYDARLVNWKRHELCTEIESLGLIYYAIPWLEDVFYIEDIRKKFTRARFFNHTKTGGYQKLTPVEVNGCVNECRVGLCLSAEEGAMYASIQYLLAGLPVVTTPSRGGREEFFDHRYVITVEATREAVRRGVEEALEMKVEANQIREGTIAKMAEHRRRFVELGERIYKQENCTRSFADDFQKAFSNRLLKQLNHQTTIDLLS